MEAFDVNVLEKFLQPFVVVVDFIEAEHVGVLTFGVKLTFLEKAVMRQWKWWLKLMSSSRC